ncbi:MAG TPA: M48 family metallopeptidase [Chitinophagaceae bacterium]
MKPYKLILFFFLVIFHYGIAAQVISVHTFQKDDSLLKKTFYDESLRKKKLLIASAEKKLAADYKKIYDEQFDAITDIWKGSRPITSADAHSYLQAVVKKITAANPEISGTDARVVFSRDWWPNAFSMGDGTIVINAGLLIYLNNEAELAFIVGHELAHYYLEHTPQAIKKYVETINSEAYQSELKRLSKTEYRVNQQLEQMAKAIAFNSHGHRRDRESEADRYAFMFMKKAGFDCNAIRSCLNLLDKVDDSVFHQSPKLETVFSFDDYFFKKRWVQKESSIFSELKEDNSPLSEKEKDSLKTHPDCSKRIAMLEDSMLASGNTGKQFAVDEKAFSKLKKEFILEMTEQCFREKKLSRNLYYSLMLLQTEEHKAYAVYSIARCLNEIYVSQRDHKLGLMVDVESKGYREEYNLLLRMLSKLRLEEIANLNYYFCSRYRSFMNGDRGFEEEGRKAQRFKN